MSHPVEFNLEVDPATATGAEFVEMQSIRAKIGALEPTMSEFVLYYERIMEWLQVRWEVELAANPAVSRPWYLDTTPTEYRKSKIGRTWRSGS